MVVIHSLILEVDPFGEWNKYHYKEQDDDPKEGKLELWLQRNEIINLFSSQSFGLDILKCSNKMAYEL
jgi:hypothetical protein